MLDRRVLLGPLLLLSLALPGGAPRAQAPHPYNGTWNLALDAATGVAATTRVGIHGTVDVKDDGGSWKTVASFATDQCAGREAPLVVHSASAEQLVFRVMRSKVLAGCPDFTVTMQRVGENDLQGKLANGWKVQMTRQ